MALARLVLAAGLLIGPACKKDGPPPPPPAPVGIEGASCYSGPCNAGLVCTPSSRRCARPDNPELVAARAAALAAERRFLEQSGVAAAAEQAPAAADDPTRPPAAGAVRIVHTATGRASSWTFAACRPDERLVGGGCKLNDKVILTLDSYPSHGSANDTVGARWNCGSRGPGILDLEAYALCQRL
jgi:hypothetical protein